jgi:hypothetical protein
MSSSSEPRQFPFTNDVGNVYDNPEKPPLEEEPDTSTTAVHSSPATPIVVDTQQYAPFYPSSILN